jgi:7,8-dihydropterin-6-yl-methyl-4-(beta-D-ribofuranosyl)aminobenzene 5'-phosphate synthase
MSDSSGSHFSRGRRLAPSARAPGEKIGFGTCRSVKVTCVSEAGWVSNAQLMQDVSRHGGMQQSQWRIPWDKDNARGSCSLVEVVSLDGARRCMALTR